MTEVRSMTRYVLMFAGVHLPTALLLGWLMTTYVGERISGMGFVLDIAVASFVGLRFVKAHQRLFSDAERRWLIAGCLTYLLLFEAFGTWGSLDTLSTFSRNMLLFVAAFTVLMNLVTLWLSFRYVVPRAMQKQLERL